jgi:hypothetical protein
MLASIVSVFLFIEFWRLIFGHTMKGGLRMDLSCITGTFSAGQRMLSHRKWSCIKEEEIVRSLFLHTIKFYFQHPIYKTLSSSWNSNSPIPYHSKNQSVYEVTTILPQSVYEVTAALPQLVYEVTAVLIQSVYEVTATRTNRSEVSPAPSLTYPLTLQPASSRATCHSPKTPRRLSSSATVGMGSDICLHPINDTRRSNGNQQIPTRIRKETKNSGILSVKRTGQRHQRRTYWTREPSDPRNSIQTTNPRLSHTSPYLHDRRLGNGDSSRTTSGNPGHDDLGVAQSDSPIAPPAPHHEQPQGWGPRVVLWTKSKTAGVPHAVWVDVYQWDEQIRYGTKQGKLRKLQVSRKRIGMDRTVYHQGTKRIWNLGTVQNRHQ